MSRRASRSRRRAERVTDAARARQAGQAAPPPQPAPQRRSAALTLDALINEYARLGTNDNLLAHNQYQPQRLTQQYALMDSLYRGDWIANRIINTIPEDMIKNWIDITSAVTPDQLSALDSVIRRTHVRDRLREGLRWGRLYGGAAAVMVIKGQEDCLDQPLDMDMLMPGDFRGLIVADRWNGCSPSSELVEDLDDPDYGLPCWYDFDVSEDDLAGSVRVHHSRVLRFTGRDLPYIEKLNEQFWGMSELEHVFAELNKRNSASANIAQLIYIAHLRVLKMENLGQNLALGDIWSQTDLYNTLAAQNFLMNNMSLQVLSQGDDFQTFDYTFSGLSDVYEQFMLDIAGAAEIPATKLFGRAPQGMNATGEGDLRNYYDTVRQNQETHLRPVLEKILPVLCLSAWGVIPDDLDFTFNPIRDTSDQERAGLIQQTAGAIINAFNAGVISQRTALMELRESGTEYGMWTKITDEDIEAADDQTAPPGEAEGGEDPMAAMLQQMQGGGGAEQPGAKPAQGEQKPAQGEPAPAQGKAAAQGGQPPADGKEQPSGDRRPFPWLRRRVGGERP